MSGTFSTSGQSVTNVTAPLVNSGLPTRPNLSISAATTSAAGSMSAADKTLVNQLTTDSGWIALPYATNWSDFGGGFTPGGYKKDALGRVWVTGLVKKSVGLGYPDTIGTLPAGYRPTTEHAFSCYSTAGYSDVRIDSAGNVKLAGGGSATAQGIEFSFTTDS